MQSYNLNSMNISNILWSFYAAPVNNLLYVDLEKALSKVNEVKKRAIKIINIAILYTTLFVFLAGSLLLKGVSVINGTIHFEPSLVILPTVQALFGMFGVYIMLEMIKYAFNEK